MLELFRNVLLATKTQKCLTIQKCFATNQNSEMLEPAAEVSREDIPNIHVAER
jgi:hypothetical protein